MLSMLALSPILTITERNPYAMTPPKSTISSTDSIGTHTTMTTPSTMAANNIEPSHTSRAAFYIPPLIFTNPVNAANYATATFAVTVLLPTRPHSYYPIIVAVDEEIELSLNDVARILDLLLPPRPGHPILNVHWANAGSQQVPNTRLSGDSLKPLLRLMKQKGAGDMLVVEQS